MLWVGLRRLRRAQVVVMGRHEQRDIVAEVVSLDSQVRNLREAVEILTDQLDEHKAHLDRALTNRAIVRYDAFRDAGGEQSASFALLDSYRSGVVFSAIAARDFARIYVKHLDHGASDRELSPEEVRGGGRGRAQAARARRGTGARPARARHRRAAACRRPPTRRRRERREPGPGASSRSSRRCRAPPAPAGRTPTARAAAPSTHWPTWATTARRVHLGHARAAAHAAGRRPGRRPAGPPRADPASATRPRGAPPLTPRRPAVATV